MAANKYGESGEAARLRKLYDAEKDATKKAAYREQLNTARANAGLRTRGGSSTQNTGSPFMGGLPKNIQDLIAGSKIDDATGALGSQLGLNQYIAGLNADLNRPDEVTPFGSSTYTRDPLTGKTTRSTTLSQGQQQINNLQEDLDIRNLQGAGWMRNQVSDAFRDPYSLAGIQAMPGQGDLLGERQRVEDQIYNNFQRRMTPEFDRQKQALQQQMADMGIPMGSARYTQAMGDLARQQSDASLNAQTQATQLGGTEMSNNFNMGLQGRQQAIGEYEAARNAPLNEMNALQNSVRGVMQPNYTPFTAVDAGNVDIGGTYLGYGNYGLSKDATSKIGSMGGGGGSSGGSTSGIPWSSYSGLLGSYNSGNRGVTQSQNQPRQSAVGTISSNLGAGMAYAGAKNINNNRRGY